MWYDDSVGASLRGCPPFSFLRTTINKRYPVGDGVLDVPPASSWMLGLCDAAHHRVVGDADPYDPKRKTPDNLRSPTPRTISPQPMHRLQFVSGDSPKRKKPVCHRSPTPRTILTLPMHRLQYGSGPCPEKMTLGDSVNNRQGSFPFSFGI